MLNFEIGTRIGKFTISDDLTRVAIVDQDVIQGWEIVDLEKGDIKFLSESVGHLAKVTDISFTKDGQQIVSGDSRGKVLAFNVEDGKQVGGVDGFQTMIKEIVTKGEGGFVAMDRRGVARGSAHSNRAKIKPFNRTLSGATALTDNGNRLAFLLGSDINVADVNSQKVVRSFTPNVRPDSIQFSRDQKYLLLQNSNEIAVWDWRRGVRERAFNLVASSPGSKIVFGRSIDKQSIAVVAGKDQNQISIYELPSESGDK
jgi:WD40 repeat protein